MISFVAVAALAACAAAFAVTVWRWSWPAPKPPEAAVLWGRCLACATAFGLGDEVVHDLSQPRLWLNED